MAPFCYSQHFIQWETKKELRTLNVQSFVEINKSYLMF